MGRISACVSRHGYLGLSAELSEFSVRATYVGLSDEWHLVFAKSFEYGEFGFVSGHF